MSPHTQWEYRTAAVELDALACLKTLTDLGRDRWQLAHMGPQFAILMRPILETSPNFSAPSLPGRSF